MKKGVVVYYSFNGQKFEEPLTTELLSWLKENSIPYDKRKKAVNPPVEGRQRYLNMPGRMAFGAH